ncbi:hypothetical protein [Burkholderia sp. Ac-20353]|nr:hypothetical protein [Burkholderia sp. Ac-20353]
MNLELNCVFFLFQAQSKCFGLGGARFVNERPPSGEDVRRPTS